MTSDMIPPPQTAPPAPVPPAARPADPKRPRLLIRPRSGWGGIDLGEVWRHRELLWYLVLRDVQLRYKQAAFGVAWAVVQPVVAMLAFALFFGYLGGMGERIEGGIPYAIYVFCALLPWQLFSSGVTQASTSIVTNRGLVTKVYFPRALLPLAGVLCNLLDFAVSLVVLVGLMAWYGIVPGWSVLALPLLVLLAVAAAVGVSLWLSALNAIYRDVQYTLGFLIQVWLFATPVAYPSTIVPERWRWLLGLNPMAGVVDGFRWCLLGADPPDAGLMLTSLVVVVLLLVGGSLFFRRLEKVFPDAV
jgi:lipopolysaccharide transport system permease protein